MKQLPFHIFCLHQFLRAEAIAHINRKIRKQKNDNIFFLLNRVVITSPSETHLRHIRGIVQNNGIPYACVFDNYDETSSQIPLTELPTDTLLEITQNI